MPELTHNSVQQLLLVLDRTGRNSSHGIPLPEAYHDAVRFVADRYGVTYQTIGDLCRRRLALSDIDEFMHLLRKWLQGDGDALRRVVKKQANSAAQAGIDRFFAEGHGSENGEAPGRVVGRAQLAAELPAPRSGRTEELRLRLAPELARRLRLAQLAGIGPTLEDTALVMLEAGFEAKKDGIRQALDEAVGAS